MSEEEKPAPPLGAEEPTVMTPAGESAPLPYEPLKGDTFNKAPEDSLLTVGSNERAPAYMKINDILPPNGSKRFNRYLALYRPPDTFSKISVQFRGSAMGMGSTADMVEKPVLAEAVEKLAEQLEAKGTMVVDSNYEITLLSLQSTRVDASHPGQTSTFPFNNSASHDVDYPGLQVKNIHLAFDVKNTMSTLGVFIRFNVKIVLTMK